jgi:hypothetical protein
LQFDLRRLNDDYRLWRDLNCRRCRFVDSSDFVPAFLFALDGRAVNPAAVLSRFESMPCYPQAILDLD